MASQASAVFLDQILQERQQEKGCCDCLHIGPPVGGRYCAKCRSRNLTSDPNRIYQLRAERGWKS